MKIIVPLILLLFTSSVRADFTEVVEATCLINVGKKVGTGVIYEQSDDKYFVLTAGHVINGIKLTEQIKCKLYKDGKPTIQVPASIIKYVYEDDDDLGLLTISKSDIKYKI